MENLKLVPINYLYKNNYLKFINDCSSDITKSGFDFCIPLSTPHSFESDINFLIETSKGINLKENLVPFHTYWLIDSNNVILGVTVIRYTLNKSLTFRGGHIGYYIHPKKRNMGLGSKMLELALNFCKDSSIDNVLITCLKSNTASAKVILKNGGILHSEDMDRNAIFQRYYINTLNIIYNLKKYLIKNYNCHSIIIYGSFSDSTFTDSSDIDIIGFSDDIDFKTDNSTFENRLLDAWIYNTEKMYDIENLLHLYNGKILLDKQNLCIPMLNHISKQLVEKNSFTIDELVHQKAWLQKMLNRAKSDDIEGNFRYHWLLIDSLEIYFMIRGYIYLGPKKSLLYLKNNDLIAFNFFNKALGKKSSFAALQELIDFILIF